MRDFFFWNYTELIKIVEMFALYLNWSQCYSIRSISIEKQIYEVVSKDYDSVLISIPIKPHDSHILIRFLTIHKTELGQHAITIKQLPPTSYYSASESCFFIHISATEMNKKIVQTLIEHKTSKSLDFIECDNYSSSDVFPSCWMNAVRP